MKETYYFPHDYNASQDSKIIHLISLAGLQALGAYWPVIELLHQQPDSKVPTIVFKSHVRMYLTIHNKHSTETEQVCDALIESKLLISKDGQIYSERVNANKRHRDEVSKSRSYAGKVSASKRLSTYVEQTPEQMSTIERKGKEIKVKEVILSECEKSPIKTKLYPTKDEAVAFFAAEGMPSEGLPFWEFYEMRGWVQGASKIPIKKWQMAATRWMRSNRKDTQDPYANVPKQVL